MLERPAVRRAARHAGWLVLAGLVLAHPAAAFECVPGAPAFVLGAEGEGISPAIARMADETFIIPQKGTTDSFNVSVAAGMMLYEAMRQRELNG